MSDPSSLSGSPTRYEAGSLLRPERKKSGLETLFGWTGRFGSSDNGVESAPIPPRNVFLEASSLRKGDATALSTATASPAASSIRSPPELATGEGTPTSFKSTFKVTELVGKLKYALKVNSSGSGPSTPRSSSTESSPTSPVSPPMPISRFSSMDLNKTLPKTPRKDLPDRPPESPLDEHKKPLPPTGNIQEPIKDSPALEVQQPPTLSNKEAVIESPLTPPSALSVTTSEHSIFQINQVGKVPPASLRRYQSTPVIEMHSRPLSISSNPDIPSVALSVSMTGEHINLTEEEQDKMERRSFVAKMVEIMDSEQSELPGEHQGLTPRRGHSRSSSFGGTEHRPSRPLSRAASVVSSTSRRSGGRNTQSTSLVDLFNPDVSDGEDELLHGRGSGERRDGTVRRHGSRTISVRSQTTPILKGEELSVDGVGLRLNRHLHEGDDAVLSRRYRGWDHLDPEAGD